jgi:hypothetical protein
MSLSKKDYNMCLYNSLASKADDSPKNIKENIAQGGREKRGKLGDTIDLNNFVQIYPFDVIVISRGSDNKPDFSTILDFYLSTSKEKDTIVIMYSKKHFLPVNFISDDIMDVLVIMAKGFRNKQLRTHFTDNTYESQITQAMENSMNYHFIQDNFQSELDQVLNESFQEQDNNLQSQLNEVLAQSLQEQFEREQNQIWQDNAYARTF